MAKLVIEAKDFSNREALEQYLATVTDLTTETKADIRITGSVDELRKLNLSHGKKCWGVAVGAPDAPTKKPTFDRLDRGKIIKPDQRPNVDIDNSKER